ncbi:DMT family transporter [Marinobacterium rhizophilum]|uniref:DMT family transporter n=1 Tax=Marinobacterium rhizophilum TaxID=420402 RepID=A0ABY5HG99_9GAMM|nr:DMT family transporter [Marinobacterium rhizophilum]UTW11382.1 DMT family transporter [Marinobacterium rhizophilum]
MMMRTPSLYLMTVFIWGSTFFAIKLQLGTVAPEVSVAYRFALAAAILLLWCWLRKLPMRFSLQQHLWILAQGLTLFGLNYMLVYWASKDLTSGLIAVVFSTIVLMNIANAALFFGKRPTPSVLAGALFGLMGIGLVFLPEFSQLDADGTAVQGMLLSLLGTLVASIGNMISTRNQQMRLPVVQTNAYGMVYGALALGLIALAQGQPFSYELSWRYTGSLLYLALFGSVLAFGCFLTLLGRIGADRAAYTMVLFPIVALGVSTLFEGYQWTPEALLGVALVFSGNLLILMPRAQLARLRQYLTAPRHGLGANACHKQHGCAGKSPE